MTQLERVEQAVTLTQNSTSEEVKRNRWSQTVTFLEGMCTDTFSSLHPSMLLFFFSVVCCGYPVVAYKLLAQQHVCLVLRSGWWRWREAGVVGLEAGLVLAGWGCEKSAIPSDIIRMGRTKQDVSITYFLEWTEWKCPLGDCLYTLRVPTYPLQVITDS